MSIKIIKDNIVNIESKLDKTDPTLIANNDEFLQSSLYFSDYFDINKLKRFIKKCEKMIRSSEAYSTYIGDLKNDKNLHCCAIKGNITDEDADIEFHHYPFTLYDTVYIVVLEHIMKKERFTSFSITSEVLELHAENMIGLVPLSITEHELVHDGVRSISMKSVFGDVNAFVDRYAYYLDDEMVDKYNILVNIV